MRKMEIAIPAFIDGQYEEIEGLMSKFGNCRRRAYSMKWKGIDRSEILKHLHRETGLPSRYAYTAYDMIKGLPPRIAFGGLKLQRLREQGKISREKFHERRNSILACRGDANRKGNVCLRVEGEKLRVNVGYRKWVRIPIFIPRKYRRRLEQSRSYTVLVKRKKDKRGYDVRIVVDVKGPEVEEPKRVMALDINSGHVDFAVVGKKDLKPVAFGKINCHELLYARGGRKQIMIHRLVNKVTNIAKHYGAEVVAGKLNTMFSKGHRRANRKVQGMCQYKMRQVMGYKLPINGVRYRERSEAYTSKVGRKLSKLLGLDIHKASAYAFTIKIIDYSLFSFLRSVCTNEGNGSPSVRLSGGSGLTALHQATGLVYNEPHVCSEATPKLGKGGGFKTFQISILQVKV